MAKRKTVPLASLVEDFSIYPRNSVDPENVRKLCAAMEAGITLPPIVVCEKTLRVVDGFHRVRAYRRVRGIEGNATVELRSYRNEAALLLDSIAMNSVHGLQFTRQDQVRAVVMLEKSGVTVEHIALALHVAAPEVEKLRIRVASASKTAVGCAPGTVSIPLKGSTRHLAGLKLTNEQAAAHKMAPGTSYRMLARQLRSGIKGRLLDLTDDKLMGELRELHRELDVLFVSLS